MNRGRFITVEGIEGVGKTSNIGLIADLLEQAGHRVVLTREPGGTALAEQIREIVLEPAAEIPPLTELLLVFAARSAHVQHKIRPALAQGSWVLCDRFTDATLAYQGGGRGIDEQLIYQLAAAVHGDLWPDLTLLLDAPVSVGLSRAARRSALDRFEQEETVFFERVRERYLHVARSHPVRVRKIDASAELATVQKEIAAVLGPYLEQA